MSKQTKITFLVLGILAVFGIGGAFAVDNVCPEDPEIIGLRLKLEEQSRSQAERDMLKQSLVVSEDEWWKRCHRNLFMTKAEHARIVADKKRAGEESLRLQKEQRQQELLNPQVQEPTILGIAELMPPPELKTTFVPGNAWNGYVGKEVVTVYAGSNYSDPMQGVVVWTDLDNRSKILPTPTATGPVKIVAERDGVLTLKSLAGNFGIGDPNTGGVVGTVTAPGETMYYFNIRTRKFE